MIFLILSFKCDSLSQLNVNVQRGEVTFVTAQNVYAQFEDMSLVNVGDTLFQKSDNLTIPVLVIIRKSRSSSICKVLDNYHPEKGDLLLHFFQPLNEYIERPDSLQLGQLKKPKRTENISRLRRRNITQAKKEDISGRISLATYSLFSSESENRHSSLIRFNLSARRIHKSPISLISSVNYRRNFSSGPNLANQQSSFLRIQNLALIYDTFDKINITIGRRINSNFSSLGAIDGVQFENKWTDKFSTGLIVGFRPDIQSHAFNPNQIEFGAFIGLHSPKGKRHHRTTLGFLEQRNNSAIDRRYAYFQHSSRPLNRVNIFGSFELDVYRKVGNTIGRKPRLTNLYVSARYRLSNQISFSISYDSRLRVIYFETFKTQVEQLLEDEARQGLRFSFNIRPLRSIYAGINFSTRFQTNHSNKSKNTNAFIGIRKLPFINGKLRLTYNQNLSNYLKSKIFSYRYQTTFAEIFSLDFYIRNISYFYFFNDWQNNQLSYGLNTSYRISKERSFQFLLERSKRADEINHRFNVRIINRF